MTRAGTDGTESLDSGIGMASLFSLRESVRFEPFADGSAVLYSPSKEKSISLNHSAALVCAYADGCHTVERTVEELRQLFPDAKIDESSVLDHLCKLVREGFVEWV